MEPGQNFGSTARKTKKNRIASTAPIGIVTIHEPKMPDKMFVISCILLCLWARSRLGRGQVWGAETICDNSVARLAQPHWL